MKKPFTEKQAFGISLSIMLYNFTLGLLLMILTEMWKVVPLMARFPVMLILSLGAYGLMTALGIGILFLDYVFLTRYTLRKKDEE